MKTYIIYLAAGNSRRFGSNKLLCKYHGKWLYLHTLDQLAQSDYEIIVVTQYDNIYQTLSGHSRFKVVKSHQSHLGMSYTIRAGLKILECVERPFQMIFVVADQPYLTLSTVEKLIQQAIYKKVKLASVAYQDHVCNPTLFHSDYFSELMNLSGDQGGRVILKAHSDDVLYVYSDDEKEFLDVDYKEDIV